MGSGRSQRLTGFPTPLSEWSLRILVIRSSLSQPSLGVLEVDLDASHRLAMLTTTVRFSFWVHVLGALPLWQLVSNCDGEDFV